MEQALTQLDVKILFDDFTYHANICMLSDLLNLMTTSRSISLYHRSQLKIPKQCKIFNSCEFFHNFSSNYQTTFPLFDIVTHVTRCFRLTPQHRECKHPFFDAA